MKNLTNKTIINMENNEKIAVEMTAEELKQLKKFREEQAKQEAEQKRQEGIKEYKSLVDTIIAESVKTATDLSGMMTSRKQSIIDSFRTVIELKEELYKGQKSLRDGRYTDSFTNSEGTARITLGYQTNDNYDDTYTQGVEMVKEYIESLASDDKSRQLADMVNTLLSERSKMGQLKAQNVLRLEKMAAESGNAQFIDGMKVIRDAYKPIKSKQFIKVEVKDETTNEWVAVPLNMTNC